MNLFFALLGLSFLIFFHELGHFLVARLFGVRVEVFSIGFGTKIFKKTYKGTEYALSLIPLGGYVKMKGQDDSNPLNQSNDTDSYTSKTPLQRIAILLAGPLFNILLAFFIYAGFSYGKHDVLLPIVGDVQKDMPAFQAGIEKGDLILKINGEKVRTWFDVAEKISDSKTKITLTIQRGDHQIELGIIPAKIERKNVFGEIEEKPIIGIGVANEVGEIQNGVLDSLILGAKQTLFNSTLLLEGIKKLFIGDVPTSEVGGVISIVQIMDKAQENGLRQFLAYLALISINLGILNLLPIPALDGGHILFNLYELITRKAPSQKALYYLTILGWGILFGLMFLGLYNDIHRLLKD